MALSTGISFLFSILAAFLNGSFLALFKISSVAKYHVKPLVFLQYNCFGMFLSDWLSNLFLPLNSSYVSGAGNSFQFVWLAFVSGIIFCGSISCSFLAVDNIGLALSQGIFGGTAIVTSYLWATVVFEEYPSNIALSVIGIIVLIIGVFGIALSESIANYIWNQTSNNTDDMSTSKDIVNPSDAGMKSMDFSAENEETMRTSTNENLLNQNKTKGNFFLGVIFAFFCGAFGGTALVPLHYVPASQRGLVFLPAMGTGSLMSAPFVLLLNYYLSKPELRHWPEFYLKEVGIYGVVSGMIWNTNNIFAIGAIPVLGYGVVFPITQCAIFVAGMWGIFLFKELTGNAVRVFFASSIVLIIGAVMQSIGT
jgi:glucose uptake protein GlcU